MPGDVSPLVKRKRRCRWAPIEPESRLYLYAVLYNGYMHKQPSQPVRTPATAEARIQTAYDEGRTSDGQDLNRAVGIARGGSVISGGAVK